MLASFGEVSRRSLRAVKRRHSCADTAASRVQKSSPVLEHVRAPVSNPTISGGGAGHAPSATQQPVARHFEGPGQQRRERSMQVIIQGIKRRHADGDELRPPVAPGNCRLSDVATCTSNRLLIPCLDTSSAGCEPSHSISYSRSTSVRRGHTAAEPCTCTQVCQLRAPFPVEWSARWIFRCK